MRIMIAAVAPWAPSGYGTICARLAKSLKADGHEVAIASTYGLTGGITEWEGIKIFPNRPGGDALSSDIILGHVDFWKPDLVFTLSDLWNTLPFGGKDFRWIPWVPIDCDPLPPYYKTKLQAAWKVVSMSEHGQKQLDDAGIENVRIPHGISKGYFQDNTARRAWRESHNIGDDVFVFGSVGLNAYWPSRKGFDSLIEAFKHVHDKYPNTLLYLHTSEECMTNPHFNLRKTIDAVGLDEKAVIFTDPYPLFVGYDEDNMRALYNGFDCFVLATRGEGFGLPVVEAQACGVPVIATDCTSMPELTCEEMRILVPAKRYMGPGYAYQYDVYVDKLVEAMEQGYEKLSKRCECGEGTCDGYPWRRIVSIVARKYQWDIVYREFFQPFLEHVIRPEIESDPATLFPSHIVIGKSLAAKSVGTTARVWECTWNDKPAVVKLAQGGYVGRPLGEVKILLDQCNHPNIPMVYEFGKNQFGRPYLVVEPGGENVAKILPNLNRDERQEIYKQVESAIKYLHSKGIVHGDVKADNVLWDGEKALLVDYGWSKNHTAWSPCPDIDGYGPDSNPTAINGIDCGTTGLPTLRIELMPEDSVERDIALSNSIGNTNSYYKLDGVDMEYERDPNARWELMKADVAGKRVLDIGCNSGWFCGKAMQEGAKEAVGIDSDPLIIKAAKRLFPKATFRIYDVDKGKLDSLKEVDTVFALSVLMHLSSPGKFWKLLDHVKAKEVYLEVPTEGYEIAAPVEKWETLIEFYGWKHELLGYSERNRPLFRLTHE